MEICSLRPKGKSGAVLHTTFMLTELPCSLFFQVKRLLNEAVYRRRRWRNAPNSMDVSKSKGLLVSPCYSQLSEYGPSDTLAIRSGPTSSQSGVLLSTKPRVLPSRRTLLFTGVQSTSSRCYPLSVGAYPSSPRPSERIRGVPHLR